MNRKGFTLIEMIITIALVAIISVVISININSLNKNTKVNECNNYFSNLENSACVAVETDKSFVNCMKHNYCEVSFNYLYENGYVKELNTNCSKSPRAKVLVTWNDDGEKKCEVGAQ